MELQVVVPGKSEAVQSLNVSDECFGSAFNESLIHQVVTAYLAGQRQGTHAQKTRSEVRGGGKKPWRQKGTGRARAGTIRSPLWRGGGVVFAAKPRDYSKKLNKKMYKVALRSIMSELIRQDRLLIVENLHIEHGKTKEVVKLLKDLSLAKVLIVTDELDEKLYLGARNLINVEVQDAISVEPVSLIRFDKVLVTSAAIKKIEERLQ